MKAPAIPAHRLVPLGSILECASGDELGAVAAVMAAALVGCSDPKQENPKPASPASATLTQEGPKQEATAVKASAVGEVDRTALPRAEPTHPAITELGARNAKGPPPFEVKAPTARPMS